MVARGLDSVNRHKNWHVTQTVSLRLTFDRSPLRAAARPRGSSPTVREGVTDAGYALPDGRATAPRVHVALYDDLKLGCGRL